MKIKRFRQPSTTTSGITVEDKPVPSAGAGVARALQLAFERAVGEHVAVLEYGEVIGRAVRTEHGAVWIEGGGQPA